MAQEKPAVRCELCGRPIAPHAHYIVRIDVFADPSLPAVSAEEVEALDLAGTMEALLKEMEQFTADDLQDQVHRRFEYRICPGCQHHFLANPLGKPRRGEEGQN